MATSSPPHSSPTCSASPSTDTATKEPSVPDIPIEIVSEEEMAFIEAALSAAAAPSSRLASRSWAPLSPCRSHATSVRFASSAPPRDIEDCAGPDPRRSLYWDYRSGRGFTVSDFAATEWCEKQKELSLLHGKPRRTEAMIAGSIRHLQLEEEIVEKVQIQTKSKEDSWAVKFLNSIVGTNQLFFQGMTRELPVVGFVEGVWLKGVIDEVRMPETGTTTPHLPILVETKTRQTPTLPSEAQKRNAKLQLMYYKHLWDNLASNAFPKDHFFKYYSLSPYRILSDDVTKYIASLEFHGNTLDDVLTYYGNACRSLPPSQEQLLLRYELQLEHSLLEDCWFEYDADWLHHQIRESIGFWSGEREANYVPEAESWKCRFCSFAEMCPKTAPANQRS